MRTDGLLTDLELKKINEISKLQERRAYQLAKFFKNNTTKDVSYVIDQEMIFLGNELQIQTRILRYPKVRVHHGKSDNETEFIVNVDIDNMDTVST